MRHPGPQRKKIPYWLTLSVGVVLSCILMNAVTTTFPKGWNHWENLGSPPGRIKTILDVWYGNKMWVETQDGNFFEGYFSNYYEGSKWEWTPSDSVAFVSANDDPALYPVLRRGNDCEKLQDGVVPFNPKGHIVECVYVWESYNLGDIDYYFALMADGNILYWHNTRNSADGLGFSCFTFPLIVAIIISAIYLGIYVVHRDSRRSTVSEEVG